MASAKDVRDILELPSQPANAAASGAAASDAGPAIPNQPFNLKPPPPPRNRSSQEQVTIATTTESSSTAVETLPLASTSLSSHSRKSKDTIDGIPRELYALIGDNAPSLAAVRKELGLDKDKGGVGGIGRNRSSKQQQLAPGRWEWTSFTPAHHPAKGHLTLGHWRRRSANDSQSAPADPRDETFAGFGSATHAPNVMQYSQYEYDHHLADPDWSAQETAYLWSLLQAYDLRFHIVADRYAYLPQGGRSGQDDAKYAWPPPMISRKAALTKQQQQQQQSSATEPRERRTTRSLGGAAASAAKPNLASAQASRLSTPMLSEDADMSPAAAPRFGDVRTRSLEEIKHRYYSVCQKLIRARPSADESVKEKLLRAHEFDKGREIARKRQADSLFHLTKAQIQEEEALYVELKKMEAIEKRYKVEREELMKVVGGLESGVFKPTGEALPLGPNGEVVKQGQGNRVFSNGAAFGVGVNRTVDGMLVGSSSDKNKKKKRNDETAEAVSSATTSANAAGGGASAVTAGTPTTAAASATEPTTEQAAPAVPAQRKQPDAAFDAEHNIHRIAPPPGMAMISSSSSSLASSRTLHVPATFRSTRLPPPITPVGGKPTTAVSSAATTARVHDLLLRQHGVNPARLIMPTRGNVQRLERLVSATGWMVEMKKQVDRLEAEVRVLKGQKALATTGHV